MDAFQQLSRALQYPSPGYMASIRDGVNAFEGGPAKDHYQAFVRKVADLSLGEWEELYTRTLDLNPETAPYVGYQIWGENYKRGEFMSKLNRAFRQHDIDKGGELPDHLIPLLRFLGSAPNPPPELQEVFQQAVKKMIKELSQADSGNPYVHLLKAVHALGNSRIPQES